LSITRDIYPADLLSWHLVARSQSFDYKLSPTGFTHHGHLGTFTVWLHDTKREFSTVMCYSDVGKKMVCECPRFRISKLWRKLEHATVFSKSFDDFHEVHTYRAIDDHFDQDAKRWRKGKVDMLHWGRLSQTESVKLSCSVKQVRAFNISQVFHAILF